MIIFEDLRYDRKYYLSAESDVVVDVLAPCDEHHGDCVVVSFVSDVHVR